MEPLGGHAVIGRSLAKPACVGSLSEQLGVVSQCLVFSFSAIPCYDVERSRFAAAR